MTFTLTDIFRVINIIVPQVFLNLLLIPHYDHIYRLNDCSNWNAIKCSKCFNYDRLVKHGMKLTHCATKFLCFGQKLSCLFSANK